VAGIIAELKLDVPSVCAGLLHDCVEDTSATVDDISKLFGSEVALLVEGVTKLGKVRWQTARSIRRRTSARCCWRWRATSASS
jgi:guanosine-3',5'-bis(diphosphate) 3'-pyrophosphohydrolase